jgi:hypothetical protein
MVTEANLYANGAIVNFGDEQVLIRDLVEIKPLINDRYHTVQKGDRLDMLAYKFYSGLVENPARYWWVIADANFIFDPLDISEYVGQRFLIPDIVRVKLSI